MTRELADLVRSRTDGWDDLPLSVKIDHIVAEHDAQLRIATPGLYRLLRFSGGEMRRFKRRIEEELVEPRTP